MCHADVSPSSISQSPCSCKFLGNSRPSQAGSTPVSSSVNWLHLPRQYFSNKQFQIRRNKWLGLQHILLGNPIQFILDWLKFGLFWITSINICNSCVRQSQWALKHATEIYYTYLIKAPNDEGFFVVVVVVRFLRIWLSGKQIQVCAIVMDLRIRPVRTESI